MSTDKILQRIQIQIDELTPTLELFVDDTIQPSVADCEQFQKILTGIQENVAIYKYNKLNKEISPSFNIHAKLSAATGEKEVAKAIETENKTPATTEDLQQIKETVKFEAEEKKEAKLQTPESLNKEENEKSKIEPPKIDPDNYRGIKMETQKTESGQITFPKTETTSFDASKPKPPLAIGLNDKFRFMNDLFGQNSSEYNIALEQINSVNNWNEAEIYLNSLKNVYEWDPKEEVVKYFYSLVKKRFD
ncbi:hypothetical protein CNR22_12790 [Sphingobacteriaceae bacterium]|nr:hypothetical protein CNR22_12790 [Sphingobacteriaceae bacterium]